MIVPEELSSLRHTLTLKQKVAGSNPSPSPSPVPGVSLRNTLCAVSYVLPLFPLSFLCMFYSHSSVSFSFLYYILQYVSIYIYIFINVYI